MWTLRKAEEVRSLERDQLGTSTPDSDLDSSSDSSDADSRSDSDCRPDSDFNRWAAICVVQDFNALHAICAFQF